MLQLLYRQYPTNCSPLKKPAHCNGIFRLWIRILISSKYCLHFLCACLPFAVRCILWKWSHYSLDGETLRGLKQFMEGLNCCEDGKDAANDLEFYSGPDTGHEMAEPFHWESHNNGRF